MDTAETPVVRILHVGTDPGFVRDVTEDLRSEDVELSLETVAAVTAAREHLADGEYGGLVIEAEGATGDWKSLVETAETDREIPTLVLATDLDQRDRAAMAGATDALVTQGSAADAKLLQRSLESFAERVNVERELEEKSSLLDHIFNQVPSALYVKNEEARHIRKRSFEGDPQEYYGKTDIELFGDNEYARQTYADDMRVIEEGERITNKEEYNPNNEEWVLTSKVPWRDEDGDIKGLIGVSRIITEKKQYEEELKLRNRAIEEAPIGIAIYDLEDGTRSIRYANRGFEELTGYDGESIEGGTLHLLEGPETDESLLRRLDVAFGEGEAESITTPMYRRDRTPFWAQINIAPVTNDDGQTTQYVAFLQDITESKEHEQNIERRLDEFGDVLAQQLRPPLGEALEALDSAEMASSNEDLERATASVRRADKLVEDLAAINTFSVKSQELSKTIADDLADDEH